MNTKTNSHSEQNVSIAKFSKCGKYRYVLWRKWDEKKPIILFVGLNPSNATAETDDPTIRRVKRFAKEWGYGGVGIINLFAFISPYPQDLLVCSDPVGDNDRALVEVAEKCKDVVFAWGSFKQAAERAEKITKMFPFALCLGVNKDGSPKHPLYVPASVKPMVFKQNKSILERSV